MPTVKPIPTPPYPFAKAEQPAENTKKAAWKTVSGCLKNQTIAYKKKIFQIKQNKKTALFCKALWQIWSSKPM